MSVTVFHLDQHHVRVRKITTEGNTLGQFELQEIGHVRQHQDRPEIALNQEYLPALEGLEGFSHILIVWWFNRLDRKDLRQIKVLDKPYTHGPDSIGVFATRSPVRPNPIAISVVEVEQLDTANGIISVRYMDAAEGSPILDIKPYYPNSDRVNSARVPDWCSHWPASVEESASFDWDSEMNM